MKDFCQFLQMSNDCEPVCAAGVNFCSVGKNREICRTCPLADLGDRILCEHLEVYVYRDWRSEGAAIQVEGDCYLDPAAPSRVRCVGCPAPGRRVITTLAEAIALAAPQPLEE